MASAETIGVLKRYLSTLKGHGLPVHGLVLYGSHARGNAFPKSDIDVGTRIEPWPVGMTRYQTDQLWPLLITARREGLLVAA